MSLSDDGIRQLFHIPYQVPDPSAVPEVFYLSPIRKAQF